MSLLLMCLRLTKGVTHRTIFPQHEPGRPPNSQKQYSTPSSPTHNSGFWNIALWGRIWKITKPNVTLTMKISNQKPLVVPLVNRIGNEWAADSVSCVHLRLKCCASTYCLTRVTWSSKMRRWREKERGFWKGRNYQVIWLSWRNARAPRISVHLGAAGRVSMDW